MGMGRLMGGVTWESFRRVRIKRGGSEMWCLVRVVLSPFFFYPKNGGRRRGKGYLIGL